MAELLPKYLKFVKGVVDCEDIPLNISRETYQGSANIDKLKSTITKRVLKLLEDEMHRDIDSYLVWYNDFNMFLKEVKIVQIMCCRDCLRIVEIMSS